MKPKTPKQVINMRKKAKQAAIEKPSACSNAAMMPMSANF